MEAGGVLIDTCVLIEHFRSRQKDNTILFGLSEKYTFYISAVTKFEFDPYNFELTCPNGKKAIMKGHNDKGQCWQFQFSTGDCSSCPLHSQCTSAASRSVNISYFEADFREAKEYNKTDEYKSDMRSINFKTKYNHEKTQLLCRSFNIASIYN